MSGIPAPPPADSPFHVSSVGWESDPEDEDDANTEVDDPNNGEIDGSVFAFAIDDDDSSAAPLLSCVFPMFPDPGFAVLPPLVGVGASQVARAQSGGAAFVASPPTLPAAPALVPVPVPVPAPAAAPAPAPPAAPPATPLYSELQYRTHTICPQHQSRLSATRDIEASLAETPVAAVMAAAAAATPNPAAMLFQQQQQQPQYTIVSGRMVPISNNAGAVVANDEGGGPREHPLHVRHHYCARRHLGHVPITDGHDVPWMTEGEQAQLLQRTPSTPLEVVQTHTRRHLGHVPITDGHDDPWMTEGEQAQLLQTHNEQVMNELVHRVATNADVINY